jgi:hypothetical protein
LPSHRDTGSVLAADLVLAAAIVIVVAATAAAFGTVAEAGQEYTEAARNAAVVAARGEATRALHVAARLSPQGSVTVDETDGVITAVVTDQVTAAHPVLWWTTITVRGESVVPIAPYRSARD